MSIQSNFPNVKPSLMLDFANTKQLDQRVTFTRASNAAFYNGVTTAMAEQNLFLNSSTIGSTGWSGGQITITTNNATAPDSTTTATLLLANGVASQHFVSANASTTATQTCSVYAKAGTNNFLQMRYGTDATAYANFDISTGAVGTVGAAATASIVSAGSGWYRCVISTTSATANGIYLLIVSGTTAASYESNSLSTSIYLWGAQLENRSSATAYTATTTQAITNYIPVLQTAASGVARFDNNPTTGESLGLLIEESRTNLVTYSSAISDASWTKGGVTVTADLAIAPDGTQSADVVADTTATGDHRFYKTVTTTASSVYTQSFYVKANGITTIDIADAATTGATSTFNLSAVTVTNGASSTGTITSVGNSWYRCTMTWTAATTSSYVYIAFKSGGLTSYTGNGWNGIFVWGAQLELGAFATSYIPTVASQVTRAADAASMTGTNFSNWFNASEGTIYAESVLNGNTTSINHRVVWISDNTTTNYIAFDETATTNYRFLCTANSASQAAISITVTDTGLSNKLIGAYKVNDFAATANAVSVGTDTSGTLPVVNRIDFGSGASASYINGTIKKIAYYPIRLSNTNLVALTS